MPPGARVSIIVDAAGPLQQLADTAAAWGTSVDVLVEVNVGQDRCVAEDWLLLLQHAAVLDQHAGL